MTKTNTVKLSQLTASMVIEAMGDRDDLGENKALDVIDELTGYTLPRCHIAAAANELFAEGLDDEEVQALLDFLASLPEPWDIEVLQVAFLSDGHGELQQRGWSNLSDAEKLGCLQECLPMGDYDAEPETIAAMITWIDGLPQQPEDQCPE